MNATPNVLATLLLLAPVSAQKAESRLSAAIHAPISDEKAELWDVIDGAVRESLEIGRPVGLSVAVAVNDEIVFAEGYGLAELEHEVPATADTPFRIGSITKQITAAAVCRLSEKGEIEIDADMNEYVPDFPTQGKVVTVRHLLTHTSGIPSYTGLGPEWSRTKPLELTHAELLGLVAGKPFEFEPGTAYNYNNTGYYLLGVLIENVSGDGYGDHLKATIFEPLGMTRTRYDSNQDLIPGRAQGYELVSGEIVNDEPLGLSQPGAAGALVSTARDLVAWDIALRGGKVVEQETYEEMTLPFMLEDASETGYGFGLGLAERNGQACVSHGGGINGFNSYLAHYPELGLTIAVISNCSGFNAASTEGAIQAALMP